MLKFQQFKSALNVVSSQTAYFYLNHLFDALNMLNAM